MITSDSKSRNSLIEQLSWGVATLKLATSNLNISDGIVGCEEANKHAKAAIQQQILRIRKILDALEPLAG